ncbi:MAG: metal-dependent transcriptional regulator [Candidatus Marsarchaeota archaeon]|jgi:DtxR family Mn-dependent transcriptional regulator|nr:metal-dependent transcriptional regulator [Candidatus Marsarchaeota archaeon]MCL5419023.1 metal-dependent transcriptional regulator [Candidatus Marsarchaeota archaeon]
MELTRKERECLVIISRLDSPFPSRLIDVARKANIKPPTAYNLVKRLSRKGLIEERKGAIIVTARGKEEYSEIIRAHRCIETLLSRAGLDKDYACKEAQKIDYMLSEKDVKYLLKFLGNPKNCPHGRPIVV